jgi:predicted double-glycine peptidase
MTRRSGSAIGLLRGLRFEATLFLAGTLLFAAAAPAIAGDMRPVRSLLEMRRENVVVQDWDLSCGAAALATLLNYQLGDAVTEKEIAETLVRRQKYRDNPDQLRAQGGFSLLDLKRFVEGRGHKGIGIGRLKISDLIARAPIMVPITNHGYSHFVIFRGQVGNRVLLADPAWGNRTMPEDKFQRAWIEYPKFGHVGFLVVPARGTAPPNRLPPRMSEFVMFK